MSGRETATRQPKGNPTGVDVPRRFQRCVGTLDRLGVPLRHPGWAARGVLNRMQPMHRRPARTLTVIAVAGGLLAGCGASVSIGETDWSGKAEELIKGELATQSGFTSLDPSCDSPSDNFAVGDTFGCKATTPDGKTVRFVVTQDREKHINVDSTNLVTPAGLPKLVEVAAKALAEKVGVPLPVKNLDCGKGPLVVEVPAEVPCKLTDPTNNKVLAATMTIVDIETGSVNVRVNP